MGLFSFLKNKFTKNVPEEEKSKTEKYNEGLAKSRAAFANRLEDLSRRYKKVNAEYFEELEEILIEADVGVQLTLDLIENLLDEAKSNNLSDPKDINDRLVDNMFVGYLSKGSIVNEINFAPTKPTVLLVSGVNGVGKTTTIAKLAHRYIKQGKKVALVAADTFRAGAKEQLSIWANRLKCPLISGADNADPASVAYDGAQYAKTHDIDLLIVDTAGRMQTKSNLMLELGKIRRVISKEIEGAPHEAFLVIDATTGQNGVLQAKAFKEAIPLTGVVITKMDGTSKGGIILSIRDELSLPVRFIGLGEQMDDLEDFDLERYLNGLLLGNNDGNN